MIFRYIYTPCGTLVETKAVSCGVVDRNRTESLPDDGVLNARHGQVSCAVNIACSELHMTNKYEKILQ